MKKRLAFIIVLIFTVPVFSQTEDSSIILETETGKIEGTLVMPLASSKIPVVLIIAGSGPTDRDGNNPIMKNNSLKMLAEALGNHGIASVRYDKRGIAESKKAALSESDLRFEDYIKDVESWIDTLNQNEKFSELIIAGHSEGALIGLIASQSKNISKYISISGAGEPAGTILKAQLKSQPDYILNPSLSILEKLEKGEHVANVPKMLYSLFRPSVQPYMISWFKYNPQEEMAKLDKPILIIQGTTDIQVSVLDAEKLATSNKKAQLKIIEGMNHILKNSELDRAKNLETYNNPSLPLKEELVALLIDFIKN
ncbi:alpha/beta hydrolase [Algibacter sp. 2305UL17-15]|uniref:alpha/beta hydrolase n=1 Tax=Algibacter sp. 2305UL17-15 TaxID=3231268 RepID=UPI003458427B